MSLSMPCHYSTFSSLANYPHSIPSPRLLFSFCRELHSPHPRPFFCPRGPPPFKPPTTSLPQSTQFGLAQNCQLTTAHSTSFLTEETYQFGPKPVNEIPTCRHTTPFFHSSVALSIFGTSCATLLTQRTLLFQVSTILFWASTSLLWASPALFLALTGFSGVQPFSRRRQLGALSLPAIVRRAFINLAGLPEFSATLTEKTFGTTTLFLPACGRHFVHRQHCPSPCSAPPQQPCSPHIVPSPTARQSLFPLWSLCFGHLWNSGRRKPFRPPLSHHRPHRLLSMPPQSEPFVAPTTPRKGNEIMPVLGSLNRNFNIGVEVPDDTMSPADRKARATQDSQYARWVRICNFLRFLFYHKEGNMLQRALDDFEGEARALSQTWLTSDQLGSRHRPEFPRAETAGQQLSLQNLLLETLDKFMITTPAVSKFSDRLSANTTPRNPTSFLNRDSASFTTSRSTLNQSFTANAKLTSYFHPITPSSKRVAMMGEDDNTSPTEHRSSPKKHKGRQRAPIDEPVPFKLSTTKHVPSPAGGFRPIQQQNLNPFDAVPARQRVAASEVQDFAAAQIDPLGRNLTAMADTIANPTRHPFDHIRSTDTNLRTRDWVANIDPAIVPSDSVSGVGPRLGYPPSQTSPTFHHFALPIHKSQHQIQQPITESRPVHNEAYVDLTTADNISEASFHSATNSVAVNMNPVAVPHQAQQLAGFPRPVAASHQSQQLGGFPPPVVISHQTHQLAASVAVSHQSQQLPKFPPPVAVSHQAQHVAGIPPPVALGQPITPPLQRQDGVAPPSSPPMTLQDRLDLIWRK